ncbi:MAG: hypothetical protein FD163_2078 [Hyphomonadaceae bacterium]|nr:MAG: hypothetical protein FD128_1086 [Hyphomonadaceae bacterium]KAF0183884.1 MAG: hypothetical protein FD163_2078 [Hyphomonadaceae bacterium]
MLHELKTEIWVGALIARAQIAGASAYVVKKGDLDVGSVIVKTASLNCPAELLVPSRNMSGDVIFVRFEPNQRLDGSVERSREFAIDQYIQKRIAQDRDLWVVEIEDKHGRNFLIEPVE